MSNSIELIRGNDGTNRASSPTITSARTAGSTTIAVNTVTGLSGNFIAEMGTPNLTTGLIGNGVVFRGHPVSGTIIIDKIATGYTDLGSAANDIIVLKPTAEWANNIANTLKVSHNDDGTLNNAAIGNVKDSITASTDFRINPRSSTTASTATLTPNIDNVNVLTVSAQAVALAIANPTGTPNDNDILIIRIKDNGTARAITVGTAYENVSGLDMITTTTANKWSTIGIMYSVASTKWHIVSVSTEA